MREDASKIAKVAQIAVERGPTGAGGRERPDGGKPAWHASVPLKTGFRWSVKKIDTSARLSPQRNLAQDRLITRSILAGIHLTWRLVPTGEAGCVQRGEIEMAEALGLMCSVLVRRRNRPINSHGFR
jgi:hypothetical protein